MLSKIENQALEFIAGYQQRMGGVGPTRKEIAEALGRRSKGQLTTAIIEPLVAKGYLRRIGRRGCHRSLEVSRPRYFRFDTVTKQLVEFTPAQEVRCG